MPFARSSSIERLLECPAAGVLPHADSRSDSTIAAADYGTCAHHWAATGEFEGDEESVKKLRNKIAKSGVNVLPFRGKRRPDGEVFYELECTFGIRFAPGEPPQLVRPDAGLSPRQQDDWKRSQDEHTITGTADLIRAYADTERPGMLVLHVDDLKTGRQPPSPLSEQLLVYALASVFIFDQQGLAHQLQQVRLTITHWPYYPLGPSKDSPEEDRGWPNILEAWTDVGSILQMLPAIKRLKDATERLKKKLTVLQEDVNPGEHCQYCPASGSCPA